MIRDTGHKCLKPLDGLALIFDLDGVVVDSNPVHVVCWRAYLAACGVPATKGWEERMYGRRNDEIVRDLFGPGLDPAEVVRHGAEKEKLYRQTVGQELKEHLVPGVASFIQRHRDAAMAVATNAEAANVNFILDTAGLRESFRVVVHGGAVSRPKPDPEIYLRTAALLGAAPADCIVFEDSLAGVAAARAAGARVVGVTTTHPDLPHVDLRIRDFTDPGLEAWISTQKSVS